jgi:hypothetical protein
MSNTFSQKPRFLVIFAQFLSLHFYFVITLLFKHTQFCHYIFILSLQKLDCLSLHFYFVITKVLSLHFYFVITKSENLSLHFYFVITLFSTFVITFLFCHYTFVQTHPVLSLHFHFVITKTRLFVITFLWLCTYFVIIKRNYQRCFA